MAQFLNPLEPSTSVAAATEREFLSAIVLLNHFSRRCVWLCLLSVFSTVADAAENDHVAKFAAELFEDSAGNKLPYRLFIPDDYDPSKRYPLVVYLHGSGGKGNDNLQQLLSGNAVAASIFSGEQVQKDHPSFVLAAQRGDGGWGGLERTETGVRFLPEPNNEPIDILVNLIDSLTKEFSLNADQVYVTGQSGGGHGTWAIITRYPELFAAAVPLCGRGDPLAVDRITVPVWAFHGEADPAVAVEQSRMMIAALKAAGAEPRYTEYEGAGHVIWSRTYSNPELIEWIFSQSR